MPHASPHHTTPAHELSLEKRAALTSGADAWHLNGLSKSTSYIITDGPHGLRKAMENTSMDIEHSIPATCFPPAAGMASSWNPGLVREVGVAIDNFNPLAQRTSVTFADPAGMDFVVAHDIGPWRAVIEEHIPGAHFLYQQDLSALEQISKYSAFPFFYSNLTRSLRMTDERFMPHMRTAVSIADPANRIDFYATFLCDNRRLALPIQQYLAQHWPREQ